MILRHFCLLAALFAGASPAAAQGLDYVIDPGTYRFATMERVNGTPVCTETWTLRSDGSMTVESGDEVVQARYRFDHDRDGSWLVNAPVSTNGKADCMGTVTTRLDTGAHRTYFIPFNSGVIQLCAPPSHLPDGTPLIGGNCYGSLTRIDGH